MQRFGYNIFLAVFILFVVTSTSCLNNSYSDDDMARMATVVRTTMSIIKGKYYDSVIPEKITEKEIIDIVRTENSSHFKEMNQFDGELDIKIVSHNKFIGAIVWNSNTNRKLIQDLRCTLKLDDPVWERKEMGSQFTLDWNICVSKKK